MKPHQFFTSIAIAAIGTVAACASNPPPPASAPGVTSAQRMDLHVSASRLAEAKCKHAAECNEIGGNRTYATRNACMEESRGKAEDDLRVADCPHGVDSTRLEACLAETAAESCSGFASGFSRSMSCKTSMLCP